MDSPGEYEAEERGARRTQWTLNALVLLSALASSAFFVYVLQQVRPFSDREPAEPQVATSAVGQTVTLLRGEAEQPVELELRDIDDAPAYRDALTAETRKSLSINAEGRLFRLVVRNTGEAVLAVRAPGLTLHGDGYKRWQARWLGAVADADQASPFGKMILAQSQPEFDLQPGEMRQLLVFAPADAPPAAQLREAEFATGELRLTLKREEIRVTAQ